LAYLALDLCALNLGQPMFVEPVQDHRARGVLTADIVGETQPLTLKPQGM